MKVRAPKPALPLRAHLKLPSDSIPTSTLATLIDSPDYDIRTAAMKILVSRLLDSPPVLRSISRSLLPSTPRATTTSARAAISLLRAHGVDARDPRIVASYADLTEDSGNSSNVAWEWAFPNAVARGDVGWPEATQIDELDGDGARNDRLQDEVNEASATRLTLEELLHRLDGDGREVSSASEDDEGETSEEARWRRRHAVAVGGGGDGSDWVIAPSVTDRDDSGL